VQKSKGTEIFSRRLRENERTPVTLTLRIEEAFPNEIDVTSDLNQLVLQTLQIDAGFRWADIGKNFAPPKT